MRPKMIAGAAFVAVMLAGCADDPGAGKEGDDLHVVTTFSLLGDLATEIGGDHVHVHSMVPLGTDPHEYQPLPADIQQATDADLLIWNGLDMETGDGWFERLVDVAGKEFDGDDVAEAATGIEPLWLTDGDEEEVNPHAFLSPRAGLAYVESITEALVAVDPEHEDEYRDNARGLREQIEKIERSYAERLGGVPTPVLVTSERAFQYLAEDYGLSEGYLWQIDTDEQGTPSQITELIEFVQEHQPAGLLVETNVDPRPMQTVAEETGVEIVGEVYSDELGPEGSEGETYIGYLEANLAAYLAAMGG